MGIADIIPARKIAISNWAKDKAEIQSISLSGQTHNPVSDPILYRLSEI
jgi:hypothetical protein